VPKERAIITRTRICSDNDRRKIYNSFTTCYVKSSFLWYFAYSTVESL